MRILLSILMVLLFFTVALADVEREYDRFSGKTSISTNPAKLVQEYDCWKQPRILLLMEFKGEIIPKTKPKVQIAFTSQAEDWEYLNCHFTHMLVDGKPLKISKVTHNGEVISGDNILEFIMTSLFWKEFCKMAMGEKIEVKICNTEFVLSEREMKDIAEFYRIVTEGK